jgi:DNA gyrase subunit A
MDDVRDTCLADMQPFIAPSCHRYTECRLQAYANDTMLADLDTNTVNFVQNFDASVMEPTVLPSRVPNLLVNGTSGIAVGIATKIPPHNMAEVVAGLKALIRNPNITVAELMKHVPGPDFPTGKQSDREFCHLFLLSFL